MNKQDQYKNLRKTMDELNANPILEDRDRNEIFGLVVEGMRLSQEASKYIQKRFDEDDA